ncbi:hypothetical protein PHET_00950 [Paragonimus heterotremus]|uniref:Uncharacterized protein n=1 Tax=Paragonimus heterotremus TaxID=100268 RepID=A0A8J4T4D1_9TREM|nr:hypothetical protein PHET_00950 [Paragonimus heterotremus]
MSSAPRHPAFYASRRQLWATIPGNKPKWCAKWLYRIRFGSNFDTLSDVWYTIFIASTTIWLIICAVYRYREFKAQAYDPRFGGRWDETMPLNVQIASIIVAVSLLTVMFYAAVTHTGHLANDSTVLGRDLLHLHEQLSHCAIIQKIWKSSVSGSVGNVLTSTQGQQHTQAASMEDEELDTLLIRRRGVGASARIAHYFHPFSTLLYVLVIYSLLFPICILEAEQLNNEAIHPSYILHSNLDGLFGQTILSTHLTKDEQAEVATTNERPFPGHTYPITPSPISPEYTFLTVGFALLTVRYAAPFYFTSRPFSILMSAYVALSSVFVLVDAATIAVVYKLAVVGVREPGGRTILSLSPIDRTFSPFHCLILSAMGLPAVLINLLAIYVYGEQQFERALINYAQLLVSGEMPLSRPFRLGHQCKMNCNGTLTVTDCGAEQCPEVNNPSYGADLKMDDTESEFVKETMLGLPLTIAVTTKLWQPLPISSRRNSRLTRRVTTPIPSQFTSNASEASSTLKRVHGMNFGTGSGDISASVHTLTDLGEQGKAKPHKRSHYGILVTAALSFIWLLITRICLAGPTLKIYWTAGSRVAIINILITVIYLIVWLLMWFGLGVKNAWRFRLLHAVPPFWFKPNASDLNHSATVINPYGGNAPNNGGNLQQLQTAYPAFWPYIPYASWMANEQGGITAGLPVTETGEVHPINIAMPNTHMNGIPEAGSGRDSLYGCFNEIGPPMEAVAMAGGETYQSHIAGLRVGPPTVSDDSDGRPGSADRNNNDARYFKPVQGSNNYSNVHPALSSYHPSSQHSFSPAPFNTPGDGSSRGTSPLEATNEYSVHNSGGGRGKKIAAMQAALLRQSNRVNDNSEPAYATLATFTRHNLPQRAPSVNSQPPDGRDQSPPLPQSRNVQCRRNGSRVTFKEMDSANYRHNQDGANGSSDSGVYTNGHGSLISGEPQPRCSRLKQEAFTHFGGCSTATPSLDCKISANRINDDLTETNVTEEAETSTDLTRFTSLKSRKVVNRSAYSNSDRAAMTNSNDQLCSQV